MSEMHMQLPFPDRSGLETELPPDRNLTRLYPGHRFRHQLVRPGWVQRLVVVSVRQRLLDTRWFSRIRPLFGLGHTGAWQ